MSGKTIDGDLTVTGNINGGAIVQAYDDLTDTPASKSGQAGETPVVSDDEQSHEYVVPGDGAVAAAGADSQLLTDQGLGIVRTGGAWGFRRIDKYRRFLSEVVKFEEASGNRVGSFNGSVFVDVNTVGSAAGKDGNAADFVATNAERLDGPATNPIFDVGTADYFISAWFKADTTADAIIVEKFDSGALQGFHIRTRATGAVQAEFFSGGLFKGQIFAQPYVVGQFHHVVLLREAGVNRIYLDGVVGTTLSVPDDFDTTTAVTVGGRLQAGQDFDGLIDELYWKKAPAFLDAASRDRLVTDLFKNGAGRFWATGASSFQSSTVPLSNLNAAMSGTDTGVADAYVASPPADATPAALVTLQRVSTIAANANTGASTLDWAGTGATAIVKNSTGAALAASDITAGSFVEFVFDGTNWRLLGA